MDIVRHACPPMMAAGIVGQNVHFLGLTPDIVNTSDSEYASANCGGAT